MWLKVLLAVVARRSAMAPHTNRLRPPHYSVPRCFLPLHCPDQCSRRGDTCGAAKILQINYDGLKLNIFKLKSIQTHLMHVECTKAHIKRVLQSGGDAWCCRWHQRLCA